MITQTATNFQFFDQFLDVKMRPITKFPGVKNNLSQASDLSAGAFNNSRGVSALSFGGYKQMPVGLKSLKEGFFFTLHDQVLVFGVFVSGVEVLPRAGLDSLALLVTLEEVKTWKIMPQVCKLCGFSGIESLNDLGWKGP